MEPFFVLDTLIVTFQASDPDLNHNMQFRYDVIIDDTQNAGPFEFRDDALYTNAALDYEMQSAWYLEVSAYDDQDLSVSQVWRQRGDHSFTKFSYNARVVFFFSFFV